MQLDRAAFGVARRGAGAMEDYVSLPQAPGILGRLCVSQAANVKRSSLKEKELSLSLFQSLILEVLQGSSQPSVVNIHGGERAQ